MAHEIEKHDNVVFHKVGGWHGLGITSEKEFTPREGLTLAGIQDAHVEQRPVFCRDTNGNEIRIEDKVANFRTDVQPNIYFGTVSASFIPWQNLEMADFCSALVDNPDNDDNRVTCEMIGSVRNGALVWFLLKGKPFLIKDKDEIFPYICVSNGHDGKAAARITPTTVRVVCSNTLHMVVPRGENQEIGQAAFMARHTTNMKDRIEEAKAALRNYGQAMNSNRKLYETIRRRKINCRIFCMEYAEQLQRYVPT